MDPLFYKRGTPLAHKRITYVHGSFVAHEAGEARFVVRILEE